MARPNISTAEEEVENLAPTEDQIIGYMEGIKNVAGEAIKFKIDEDYGLVKPENTSGSPRIFNL